MRFRWFLLIPAVLFLSTGRSDAQQVVGLGEEGRFEFEARRWRPKLSSEFGDNPVFNLQDDLGVTDVKDQEYRILLRFGRWVKIRASGVSLDYQANKVLENDISFTAVDFPAGTSVATSMKIQNIKGGVEVDLLALREGFFAVVADYSSFKATPVLSAPGAEAGEVMEVALVTLGIRGRIYLTPAFALTAEATGMKRESSGVITDFEGAATFNLSRNIGLTLGYRNLYCKWLKGGRATFRLQGYYYGATIRF
jgi:hypothetical protein